MKRSDNDLDPKAPWRDRFLNVIEKTFLELNIEFTNYSIGQTASGEFKKRVFDNSTQGIEFADELTVCSAIINDCLSSSIMNGNIERSNNSEIEFEFKYYEFKREVPYNKNDRCRVDITIQRVREDEIIQIAKGLKIENYAYYRSYIEAKRAKRYYHSSLESNVEEGYDFTAEELKRDTQQRIDKYSDNRHFFYILVWGVYNSNDKNEKENTPEEYLQKFKDGASFLVNEEDVKVRWIPLSWPCNVKLDKPDNIVVEKWCWILLAQIIKINEYNSSIIQ